MIAPSRLQVIAAAVAIRAAVLAAGLWATLFMPLPADEGLARHLTEARADALQYLNSRWDAHWYSVIVLDGYQDRGRMEPPDRVAFFPGYPLVVGVAATPVYWYSAATKTPGVLGGDPQTRMENVGAIVSLLAGVLALVLLFELAKLDLPPGAAFMAPVFAATWPFAYVLGAAYSESLYLLGLVTAFLAWRTGRPWLALVAGVGVGLTRHTGVLLTLPLLWMWWQGSAPLRRARLGLVAALGPAIGCAIYSGYLWITFGEPLAWISAQETWEPSRRWAHMVEAGSPLAYVRRFPYESAHLLALLVAGPLVWRSRRLNPAYAIFGGVSLLVPLVVDVVPLGRMTVPVFPIYLALAAALATTRRWWVVAVVGLALQLYAAALFYSWRPLY